MKSENKRIIKKITDKITEFEAELEVMLNSDNELTRDEATLVIDAIAHLDLTYMILAKNLIKED